MKSKFWIRAGAGIAWGWIGVMSAVWAGEEPGAPQGMVWIPGGKYLMGSEHFPDSQPLHRVEVDGFWMDKTEVTNAQFTRFMDATGYVTVAERTPDAANLVPGSVVFAPPAGEGGR